MFKFRVLILLALSAAGLSVSCDTSVINTPGGGPLEDYSFIAAGLPVVSQSVPESADARAVAGELLNHVLISTDLYRYDPLGAPPTRDTRVHGGLRVFLSGYDGAAYSPSADDQQHSLGTVDPAGFTHVIFRLQATDPGLSEISVELSLPAAAAQTALDEMLALPRTGEYHSERESAMSFAIEWRVSGQLNGEPFTVQLSQPFHVRRLDAFVT